MNRNYNYFITQIPNSDTDYTQTITKGFEFVPANSVVTKFTICAETNLKLLVKNGSTTMTLYLKQGDTWSIENDDSYNFTSIKCDNTTAKVTYLLGYRTV